jgi:hypothetical protein
MPIWLRRTGPVEENFVGGKDGMPADAISRSLVLDRWAMPVPVPR